MKNTTKSKINKWAWKYLGCTRHQYYANDNEPDESSYRQDYDLSEEKYAFADQAEKSFRATIGAGK